MPSYIGEDVQNTIALYRHREYKPISRAAAIFLIPTSTFQNQLKDYRLWP